MNARRQRLDARQILVEGVLGADALRVAVGDDGPRIDGVRLLPERAPRRPEPRTSASGSRRAMSPTVSNPIVASVRALFGPTPHSRETGRGARKAAPPSAGTSTCPFGLAMSDAILATSFTPAMPADAGRPTSSAMRARRRRRDVGGRAEQRPRRGHVHERFVERQRLDQRRHGARMSKTRALASA